MDGQSSTEHINVASPACEERGNALMKAGKTTEAEVSYRPVQRKATSSSSAANELGAPRGRLDARIPCSARAGATQLTCCWKFNHCLQHFRIFDK